jgi:hypothetical protein
MPSRTPLAVRLTSERNMRINERFAARARIRRLLHLDIRPMLETANDALANTPPYVSVARERISRVLMQMADECAKLDREDAADRERR